MKRIAATSLTEGIIKGSRRCIAEAIKRIENESEDAVEIMEAIYPHAGRAHRIGITGPPGSGKSTFTNCLTKRLRKSEQTVGIIAVDPTSPITGGALFGDRIRMMDISKDPSVFIRSMATRGCQGGLSRRATEVADVLDAAGKDIILFETVGIGQIELDIMTAADTVIVLMMPNAGDTLQAMKSGLMEVGDIFVVNKADLSGAENTQREILSAFSMRANDTEQKKPVRLVESINGRGFEEIERDIKSHYRYLEEEGILHQNRMRRKLTKVRDLVDQYLSAQFWSKRRLKELEDQCRIAGRHASPEDIARGFMESAQPFKV
jgi:LAO/AO transport system kinase